MRTKATILIVLVLSMSGCWGYKPPKRPKIQPPAPRPALIGHIVFVTMNDPARTGAIRVDADRMLGTIPTVSTYASGSHLDTGRASVLNDYHLAIYLGFESEEDLAAYVEHPRHIEFVERWKPEMESIRVHDMLDLPDPTIGYCGIGGRKKLLGIF